MKSFFLLIASALLPVISANRVINLDADNFDTIVDGTRNVFIKFEASWCGPCKRMAPVLDLVARETFPDIDGDTILAAIDADSEREIGDRFDIQSFPTIKLFLKGRPQEEAIDFSGDRSPQNIARFIKEHVAANLATLPENLQVAKPITPLSKILAEIAKVGPKPLTSDNKMYEFASGCFEEKAHHVDEPQIRHKAKSLKQRKDKNRKNKKQDNTQVQLSRQAQIDSLPLVNAQQAKEIISTAGIRPVILIFFSPNCPHCTEFIPIARKYAQTRTDTIFLRINGDINIEFRDSFNLRYYPSVIGFYSGSNGNRYELMTNDRGYDNFNSFVSKLVKH